MGEASTNDRHKETTGCYIIVSLDKGFDALFGYLEGRGIFTRRAASLTEAMGIAAEFAKEAKPVIPTKPLLTANAQRVVDNLRASGATKRPTTMKRLSNHIATVLAVEATDTNVTQVLDELKRVKVLQENGTKPAYVL